MGVKKFISNPSLKIGTHDFRNFLHMSHKLQWLKTLKVSRKSVRCVRRYFAFYILVECPVYVGEKILVTESILLRSDYDTHSHFALQPTCISRISSYWCQSILVCCRGHCEVVICSVFGVSFKVTEINEQTLTCGRCQQIYIVVTCTHRSHTQSKLRLEPTANK